VIAGCSRSTYRRRIKGRLTEFHVSTASVRGVGSRFPTARDRTSASERAPLTLVLAGSAEGRCRFVELCAMRLCEMNRRVLRPAAVGSCDGCGSCQLPRSTPATCGQHFERGGCLLPLDGAECSGELEIAAEIPHGPQRRQSVD